MIEVLGVYRQVANLVLKVNLDFVIPSARMGIMELSLCAIRTVLMILQTTRGFYVTSLAPIGEVSEIGISGTVKEMGQTVNNMGHSGTRNAVKIITTKDVVFALQSVQTEWLIGDSPVRKRVIIAVLEHQHFAMMMKS
jgi:hypothetical protein